MAGVEENPSAFEKLVGYALYNGQVIDRLWSECSAFVAELNGQTDEVKLNILVWLAERWREKISSTASLSELARRYSKAPPLGSLRRAPEEFESLSDDEQGLLVYVLQESLLRSRLMGLIATSSPAFEELLESCASYSSALQSREVLVGLECHTGALSPEESFAVTDNLIAALEAKAEHQVERHASESVVEIAKSADKRFDAFNDSAGSDLEPLVRAAWAYEGSVQHRKRYVTIDMSFDKDGHLRADLTGSTKQFLTVVIASNHPDRFQYFWKAVVGDAAKKLPWEPPEVRASRISFAAPKDQTVRRCVRILNMVHELHKAGYQRLRVLPFLSPSGAYWRAWITHSDNVEEDGYSLIDWDYEETGLVAKYTSGQEDKYFGWNDAATLNARQLAGKFLDRFPKLCSHAVGCDWAYVGWLTDVMGHAERAEPNGGLIHLIHDGEHEPEYLRRWQPPPPIKN